MLSMETNPESKMDNTLPWLTHLKRSFLLTYMWTLSLAVLLFPPHIDTTPQAFGIPLSHVISNDRMHKLRHDHPREEHSDPTELMLSFLHLTSSYKRANKELSSSNSSLSSTSETLNESPLPSTPDIAPRTRRRVGFPVNKPYIHWCRITSYLSDYACTRDFFENLWPF